MPVQRDRRYFCGFAPRVPSRQIRQRHYSIPPRIIRLLSCPPKGLLYRQAVLPETRAPHLLYTRQASYPEMIPFTWIGDWH